MGSERFEEILVCPRIARETSQAKTPQPLFLVLKLALCSSSLHERDRLHDWLNIVQPIVPKVAGKPRTKEISNRTVTEGPRRPN